MDKYEVYSRELGMWISKDNKLTENESEAMLYDTIGEAMKRAALANWSGNVFRVFSVEVEDKKG